VIEGYSRETRILGGTPQSFFSQFWITSSLFLLSSIKTSLILILDCERVKIIPIDRVEQLKSFGEYLRGRGKAAKMSIGRDVGFLYLLPPPPPNQESKQEEEKSEENYYLMGLIERLRVEKSGDEVGEPNRKKQRVASSKTPSSSSSSSSSSFMDSILGGMNDIHETTRRSQQQHQGSHPSSHPMSISTSSQTYSSPSEQMGGVLEEDLRFKQEVIDTIHSFLQGLSTDITFDIVNRLDGALMFLEITRKMYCIFCSKEVCDDYEDSIVVVSSKDDVGVKFEE